MGSPLPLRTVMEQSLLRKQLIAESVEFTSDGETAVKPGKKLPDSVIIPSQRRLLRLL